MKWKEINGVLGHLCAHRLNWARKTSWGWWDELHGTALQTQDSNFEPWRFYAEHATSRSQMLSTILNLYKWARKKYFVSLKLEEQSGTRDLRLSKQQRYTYYIHQMADDIFGHNHQMAVRYLLAENKYIIYNVIFHFSKLHWSYINQNY